VYIDKILPHYNELSWNLITIALCVILLNILILFLYSLYKIKKLTLCLTNIIIDRFLHIVLAVVIFRTIIFHYAFLIWCVIYFTERLFEKHKRKLRYIHQSEKTYNRQRNKIKSFYAVNNNKFFILLKNAILLKRNNELNNLNIEINDRKWKKSLLPFNYFMTGLIIPGLNLLIYGSQYSSYNNLFFILFEINILIFTILWFLYPIAYYMAVKIETGKLFQCKIYFNISYLLFSFAVFTVLNGIIISLGT